MPDLTKRNLYPNTKTLACSIRSLQRAKVGLEALAKVEIAVGNGSATGSLREILVDDLHTAGSEISELINSL